MIDNICFNCARKHLGRANARLYEFLSGDDYPEEFWYAFGEMSLAEDHLVLAHPKLAQMIRKERIKMQDEEQYYPDLGKLIREITKVAIKESE